MNISVFDFKDYRSFLLEFFGDKDSRKGLKSKAAEFMGCHTTMISQILHGQSIPNLEQGEKLNQFIGHIDDEAHYFLLLIQKARCGTKTLETYFQNQLNQVIRSRQVIKKRVGKVETIAPEDEAKYYSSWQYAAVHVALSISDYQLAENIAKTLRIPLNQVRSILDFLLKVGLVKLSGKQYLVGPKHIHLGADSTVIKSHHVNWRLHAIQSLDSEVKSNLHYSSAVSLSTHDVDKVKELLILSLKSINKVVQTSKEEEIYGLNFDFYNLKA